MCDFLPLGEHLVAKYHSPNVDVRGFTKTSLKGVAR